MNERSVLVVDGEPVVRRALTRSLARAGYAVTAAATAEEALALIELHTFDCAIADLCLPGAGGRSFLSQAAALAPGLPMIFTSDGPSLEGPGGGLAHLRVLPRPWADSELRAVVSRAVQAPPRAA